METVIKEVIRYTLFSWKYMKYVNHYKVKFLDGSMKYYYHNTPIINHFLSNSKQTYKTFWNGRCIRVFKPVV